MKNKGQKSVNQRGKRAKCVVGPKFNPYGRSFLILNLVHA